MANFVVEGGTPFDIPSAAPDMPVDASSDFYRTRDDTNFYRVSDNPCFTRERDVNR